MVTKKPENAYDADALISLDPMVHIQKRPSLYLGPAETQKLTALRELVDNGLDEVRSGHGSAIKVVFHDDGSVTVEDDGRGIPTGINKTTGENGIFMALGKVGSGGKFGAENGGYTGAASSGLNGIGAAATNSVSTRFDVVVFQNNKEHRLSFKNGKPGRWSALDDPNAKFTLNPDIVVSPDKRSAAEKKKRPTGTTIRFWPNNEIFQKGVDFLIDELRDRLKSTAFLVPGVTITVEDNSTGGEPVIDVYHFEGGIAEMIEAISIDQPLHSVIHFQTEGAFTETVPVPQADGSLKSEEVKRPVKIDLAFRWGTGFETTIKSFVNTISTPLGGTHVQGLQRALNKVLIDNIKNTRGMLKAKEEPPIGDDIGEGLTAILSISQNEPQFVGQDKQRLGNPESLKVVSAAVTKELTEWLANKKNLAASKIIYTKIVEASRVRLAQRASKETARRKTSLESASMPSKLVDCSETSTQFSELHICEGDSALGTMVMARDSQYQALLPIRGKILNVQKASMSDMLANAECAALIQVIGAGMGKDFDVSAMRYNNIGIAVDADVDGAHIRTLLITFFWKYMRPLVEAGRLYATMPPLYVLKTSGKNGEIFYLDSDEARDKLIARLDKQGKKYEPIQRLKGLGEMDAEEFWDTTLNPETRSLRRITIKDAVVAEKMLELAMGDDVPSRKTWIIDSRAKIRDDDLDV